MAGIREIVSSVKSIVVAMHENVRSWLFYYQMNIKNECFLT